MRASRVALLFSVASGLCIVTQAQETAAPKPPVAAEAPVVAGIPPGTPTANSSFIDSEGVAHVTRVVPVSPILSPEAHTWMARSDNDKLANASIAQIRAAADASQLRTSTAAQTLYPSKLADDTIAGVSVRMPRRVTRAGTRAFGLIAR